MTTEIHDPYNVGECKRCIQGDHSNHHPALGGICIGCTCPVTSPDGGAA